MLMVNDLEKRHETETTVRLTIRVIDKLMWEHIIILYTGHSLVWLSCDTIGGINYY